MTTPIPPETLTLARYRLDFTVEAPLHLHYYAGSQLRGAFGHALRKTACMTRLKACKECPLYRTCPYPLIFETPAPESHALQKFTQVPNPYVIEPPPLGARDYAAGETLSFHMVLIGRGQQHLPLIVYAWQRALHRHAGLGGGSAHLREVHYLPPNGAPQSLYSPDGSLQMPELQPIPAAPVRDSARLRFTAPLRLQHNGKPLGHAMTARDLLMALARRHGLLTEFHQPGANPADFPRLSQQAQAVTIEDADLLWRDWRRYSNRQEQSMILGGVVGSITLRGNLEPFAALLAAGQWFHVGKNATFGLGGYHLEQTP